MFFYVKKYVFLTKKMYICYTLINKTKDMLSNKKTLSIINFLLNNNEDVYWAGDNYKVKKEKITGKLLVVCTDNGYTTGLQFDELKECYTSKYAVREYGLWEFPILPQSYHNKN